MNPILAFHFLSRIFLFLLQCLLNQAFYRDHVSYSLSVKDCRLTIQRSQFFNSFNQRMFLNFNYQSILSSSKNISSVMFHSCQLLCFLFGLSNLGFIADYRSAMVLNKCKLHFPINNNYEIMWNLRVLATSCSGFSSKWHVSKLQ